MNYLGANREHKRGEAMDTRSTENTIRVSLSLEEAVDFIVNRIINDSTDGTLLDKYELMSADNSKCIVMLFEEYYYRVGNRLVLTVTLDNFDGDTRIHYVSGGGGEALKFDWGAAKNFENLVPKLLKDYIC